MSGVLNLHGGFILGIMLLGIYLAGNIGNALYGASILKEYLTVANVQPGWEKVLDKYNIDWIFYNAESTLSTVLSQRADWHLLYADKVANIFLKKNPKHQILITKYPARKLLRQQPMHAFNQNPPSASK